MNTRNLQQFGCDWTENKLTILEKYLAAYVNALSNYRNYFKVIYIDAFAGTGYRELKVKEENSGLFAELHGKETQRFMDGSAIVSLKMDPGFDRYHFIEKDNEKLNELKKLVTQEHSSKHPKVDFHVGDANDELLSLLREYDWNRTRAVLFLDPFGLQVAWTTLEAVARTKAIDMWLLFPVSGVTRLLRRDGQISEGWARRLDNFFGEHKWQDVFYNTRTEPNLFDYQEKITEKVTDPEIIGTISSHVYLKFLQMLLKSLIACTIQKTPRNSFSALPPGMTKAPP